MQLVVRKVWRLPEIAETVMEMTSQQEISTYILRKRKMTLFLSLRTLSRNYLEVQREKNRREYILGYTVVLQVREEFDWIKQ